MGYFDDSMNALRYENSKKRDERNQHLLTYFRAILDARDQ